jgi:hypothetical protein
MTPEQRLDRLERIAKLMVKAGLRARKTSREQGEKINALIDAQMRNETEIENLKVLFAETDQKMKVLIQNQIRNDERFAKHDERFAKHDERFARFDERCAKYDELFARNDERFERNDRRLDSLIELLRKQSNGRN